MKETLPTGSLQSLSDALDTLVGRATITPTQRAAILAEVAGASGLTGPYRAPEQGPRHRSLTEMLIEAGLYVGSALVVTAGFVLVAQNWDAMSLSTQIAILSLTAVVTAGLGLGIGRESRPGSPRRRLAGVLSVATAASSAGTVALLLDDSPYRGVAAFAAALVVMVCANVAVSSTITELGMFVSSFVLANTAIDAFAPADVGNRFEDAAMSTYDIVTRGAVVMFCVLWALVGSRRLVHREVAVFVGMFAALGESLLFIDQAEAETMGKVSLGILVGLGFWRFLVDGYWPWMASAIANLTALVFWVAGGADRPVVAILLAGVVLLGSSGLGTLVARRRRSAIAPSSAEPPGG